MSSDTASLTAQVNRMSLRGSPDELAANQNSELVAVVDDLLNSLTSKFSGVSGDILKKMDEMTRRLDNLETHIQASSSASLANGDGRA